MPRGARNDNLDVIIRVRDQASRNLRMIESGLGRLRSTLGRLPGAIFNLKTAFAGLGVGFDPGDQRVCAGVSNGDPGNWGLEGTNGPDFFCFNGNNPGYVMEMTTSRIWTLVYLDVSRSNGSQAGDAFTIRTFRGSTEGASKTVVMGDIDDWSPVLLEDSRGFDRVTWEGHGSGFHPFGVDNLELDDHLLIFTDGFESGDISSW